MKQRLLLLERLKRAALLVLLLYAVGMGESLAQNQVATLQHGDDVSVYYGGNAFVEAHTAAQTGDIITLSSGSFVPCPITKAITLRGAGCAVDTVAGTNPTIFGGDITLNVLDTANFLTIEGILFTNEVNYKTLYNPKFNRCNFTYIIYYSYYSSSHQMKNAQFVNCIIEKFYFNYAPNTVLINSVVWEPDHISNTSPVVFYNSILRVNPLYPTPAALSAYNSIVIRPGDPRPQSSCSFINCIGIDIFNNSSSPFGEGYTSGCTSYTSYGEVFESFAGEFSLDESFILKDEIATGFLGNDGTQVGLYGGLIPYSNRPTYMVLKRCNVANQSTIDGKLSVEIEVVTEGE